MISMPQQVYFLWATHSRPLCYFRLKQRKHHSKQTRGNCLHKLYEQIDMQFMTSNTTWNAQSIEHCGWLVCRKWPGVLEGHRKVGKLGQSTSYKRETGENAITWLYWGILFFSLIGKVYVKCLEKICEIISPICWRLLRAIFVPAVFRPGGSTTDQTFTLQHVLDKSYWENAKDVNARFADLKKAYDRLSCEKL